MAVAVTSAALDLGMEYVQALLDGRPQRARELIAQALDAGMPARSIYVDVLQPAMYEIGELWARGRASVAQEHLASATTQTLIASLAPRLDRAPAHGRRAVVTSTEGELHALGSRFVADFLEADGWSVLELGASTPTTDLVDFVRRERPTLVALSTTLTTNLAATEDTVARLRALEPAPFVVVGGNAYRGDAAIGAHVGADLFAPDARTLADFLRDRLGEA